MCFLCTVTTLDSVRLNLLDLHHMFRTRRLFASHLNQPDPILKSQPSLQVVAASAAADTGESRPPMRYYFHPRGNGSQLPMTVPRAEPAQLPTQIQMLGRRGKKSMWARVCASRPGMYLHGTSRGTVIRVQARLSKGRWSSDRGSSLSMHTGHHTRFPCRILRLGGCGSKGNVKERQTWSAKLSHVMPVIRLRRSTRSGLLWQWRATASGPAFL